MQSSLDGDSVVLAVDIGGTNLRCAVIDAMGDVLAKNMTSTSPRSHRGEDLTTLIVQQLNVLIHDVQFTIVGIGVSVAGPLKEGGNGFLPTNIATDYVPLVIPLTAEFGVPVHVLNDTNAAVYGEWLVGQGNGGSEQNLAYITVSTGIGCGVIVGGHLALGRDGSFGHVGQIAVDVSFVDGQHDWEYYSAGTQIVAFYDAWCKSRGYTCGHFDSPRDLYAAENSTENLKDFFCEVGKVNGQGVSNVIHAYNPSTIVFGGSVARKNWQSFMCGVKANLRTDIIQDHPRMVLTELGDEVSLIGVGLYMHREILVNTAEMK